MWSDGVLFQKLILLQNRIIESKKTQSTAALRPCAGWPARRFSVYETLVVFGTSSELHAYKYVIRWARVVNLHQVLRLSTCGAHCPIFVLEESTHTMVAHRGCEYRRANLSYLPLTCLLSKSPNVTMSAWRTIYREWAITMASVVVWHSSVVSALSQMWPSLDKPPIRRKYYFYSTRANMSVCVASSISNFRCRTCLLYLPYLHAKFQVQRPLRFREREALPIAIAEERNKNTESIRVRNWVSTLTLCSVLIASRAL